MTPEETASPVEEQENTPTPDPGESGSPEGTPAETETPEVSEAPESYEDRYKEAQAWGTRAAQEAAMYREIIDAARAGDPEALEYLGYEAGEDTGKGENEEWSTDEDQLAKFQQEFQEWKAQQEQAQQEARLQEAAQEFYRVEFNRLDPGNDWSESYRRLVAAVGDEHLDSDGLPQLEEAHKALQAEFEAGFKKRVQSKRTPQAPSGASPSHEPNLDDREERREYIARRIAQGEQDPV
jgi:PAS domain-containing protein